jgi:hypothetical protein
MLGRGLPPALRMKKPLLFLLIWSVVESTSAQTPAELRNAPTRPSYEELWAINGRIRETYPERRESPVRLENIRDEEVREIQTAVQAIFPEAIVNIATVVTGCPCEEGPTCTDQVWILASRPDKTLGLQLSKVAGHWGIGLIQRWWLRYSELQKRESVFRSPSEYDDAVVLLKGQFPSCR